MLLRMSSRMKCPPLVSTSLAEFSQQVHRIRGYHPACEVERSDQCWEGDDLVRLVVLDVRLGDDRPGVVSECCEELDLGAVFVLCPSDRLAVDSDPDEVRSRSVGRNPLMMRKGCLAFFPAWVFAIVCWICENLPMADDRVADKLFEVESEPAGAGAVTPVGAHKRFRPYDQSQSLLLPPSLDDWLPENHEARFISDVAEDMLDVSCIYDSYTEASGAPPYDPAMMVKLLLFAYWIGVTSSREMERRCHVDVAFRWLSANAAFDYRSLSRFRRRHLVGIDALFV